MFDDFDRIQEEYHKQINERIGGFKLNDSTDTGDIISINKQFFKDTNLVVMSGSRADCKILSICYIGIMFNDDSRYERLYIHPDNSFHIINDRRRDMRLFVDTLVLGLIK